MTCLRPAVGAVDISNNKFCAQVFLRAEGTTVNAKERAQWLHEQLRDRGFDGDWSVKSVQKYLKSEGMDEKSISIGGEEMDIKKVIVSYEAGDDVELLALDSPEDSVATEEVDGDVDEKEMDDEDGGEKRYARNGRPIRKAPRRRQPTETERKYNAATAGIVRGGTRNTSAKSLYDARVKQYGVGGADKQPHFHSADQAEAFGAWYRSSVFGDKGYSQRDNDERILSKTNITTAFADGGALVPEQFIPELINLAEERNLVDQILDFKPMSGDTAFVPRKVNGATGASTTVTIPGEGQAATTDGPSFDGVSLVAFKPIGLSIVTNEMMNDSALDFGQIIAEDHTDAHGQKLESLYLNGASGANEGGVTGIVTKLKAQSANPEDSVNLHLGADAWNKITMDDIVTMFGLIPDWRGIDDDLSFVCTRQFYHRVLVRLMIESNTSTPAPVARSGFDVSQRAPQNFLGYPVFFSPEMSSTESTDEVPCILGAHKLASKAGRVNGGMTLDTSSDRYFEYDSWAVRSTQRVALNPGHDLGDSSTNGGVVGLIMA